MKTSNRKPENPQRIEKPQRWDTPFDDRVSDQDVDQLLKAPPFSSMDPDAFSRSVPLRGILTNDCKVNHYRDNEIIIREGDYGSSAFLILSGEVVVSLKSIPGEYLGRTQTKKKTFFESLSQLWTNSKYPEVRRYDKNEMREIPDQDTIEQSPLRVFLQDVPRVLDMKHTETLVTGEFFGELAALTRSPRSATIISKGESVLFEIRWQGLRELMRRDNALRDHIDNLYREHSLKLHLRETDLLRDLPESSINNIAEHAQFETFDNFDWQNNFKSARKKDVAEQILAEPVIAEKGDYPNGLILIRNGFCRLSRPYGNGHQTIAYLGKGESFGLRELTHIWQSGEHHPWLLSLRAVGYVDTLRIPTAIVESDILPHLPADKLPPAIVAPTREKQKSSERRNSSREQAINTDLLEFLMDNRFINGTQAMAIDMNKCTRCDDCVRACASTHDNNPRFVRQGPMHHHLMIAGACMHCVDPVCMIGCPTGAIGRDQSTGYVVINDNTCIGCSTCANSCPYQNIRMVHVRNEKGDSLVDQSSGEPIAKATKCDLCVEQSGGPACQNACPHDALVRIDLSNSDELRTWLGH